MREWGSRDYVILRGSLLIISYPYPIRYLGSESDFISHLSLFQYTHSLLASNTHTFFRLYFQIPNFRNLTHIFASSGTRRQVEVVVTKADTSAMVIRSPARYLMRERNSSSNLYDSEMLFRFFSDIVLDPSNHTGSWKKLGINFICKLYRHTTF